MTVSHSESFIEFDFLLCYIVSMEVDVHQKLFEDNSRDVYKNDSASFAKSWSVSLVKTIGLWTLPEEEFNGREYRYLLDGEAFDWLLLAERFCDTFDGRIPDDECGKLLFNGVLPRGLTVKRFKEMLGQNKYRAILNFWYGVVVEEALQLSVEEEVRKEKQS